jgi:3-oxoacyl-[acyl-carrier protein] reductase
MDEIVAQGGVASTFGADLTCPRNANDLIEHVVAEWGRVDVLVNAVGVRKDSLLMMLSDTDLDSMMDINLKTAFWLTRAVAKYMVVNHSGVIVNISSAAASRPRAGHSHYVACKAGIEGFTRAMAVELAPKGIRVNAVAPGIVVSDITNDIRERSATQLLSEIPMRRFGTPDNVATAVRFLASADAEYITGQVLHVDGGRC